MGVLQSVANYFATTPTPQPHPESPTNIVSPSQPASSTAPHASNHTAPSTTRSPRPNHTVFISHAGEDKATIAIPLREMLMTHRITAFVDETDMPPGTPAADAMVSAMECAEIAVIVLSPEFVARKWPMKELMCFLRRREQASQSQDSECSPLIIPFFYRLAIPELYDEPRLERVDSDGKSLYLQSRFLERMNAGEPEANIDNIKIALQKIHGIMGVRNDVNASNGSAYTMYQRRGILLRELCDKIRRSVRSETVTGAGNIVDTISRGEDDLFHSYFDPTPDTSDLVFDFGDSGDEDLKANTQESNILRLVLDESGTAKEVIAIHGIAGVGKTSMLDGISCLERVKAQFKDGVHGISLGMDATKGDVIEELSKAVERSGGVEKAKAMRREKDIGKVTESLRSWFEKKKCLFTVDDIWQSEDMTSSVIYELMRLHVSGDGSKVILTTRSMEIASRAKSHVKLKPRDVHGVQSRRVLIRHAEITVRKDDEDEEAVNEILERCGGLPLFLAVAGKAVKVLSLRPGHEGCAAYHVYAGYLKANVRSMITTDVEMYQRLDARLMISIDALEERKANVGFVVSRCIAEIHRRLSVMKKQSKVPMRMLKHLWEVENETEAAILCGELEQAGLAEVEYERRGSDRVEVLRLHDSLYEFAVSEARKFHEERLGHELIVRGYRQGLSVNDGYAEWWSLEDDGYILGNICRHLFFAGRSSELVRLVLSPQWTERQLKVNGILDLEADFSLAIESVQNGNIEHDSADCDTEEALRMISEAATLSWSFVSDNFRELGFQMHGRLKRYEKRLRCIRDYVRWIETKEGSPSILCANSFLLEPGGPNVSIVSVNDQIVCMTAMKDRELVVCGYEHGDIAIVNTVRKEVKEKWQAHEGKVTSIAVGRKNTRLVSAGWTDAETTVKVWDFESGSCVTTFRGHTGAVLDLKVMKDDKRVVSVSADGTAQIWDMDTGDVVSPTFTGHEEGIRCVTVFGDDEHVITGGDDDKLRMWSSRTGHQVGVSFQGHENDVVSIAISPDGRRVVSGSADTTVRIWDVESHSQVGPSLTGHTSGVNSVAFSGDGSRIVSGSWDTTIRVWDCESGNEVCPPLIGHGYGVRKVSFLEGDDFIVSCSADTTLRLWDLRRQKAESIPNRHESSVTGVAFTPDGKFIVSASFDGTLRIWDSTSGDQVGDPLKGHSHHVSGLAITPNGRFIVSVLYEKTVCVWDLQTRSVLHTFTGHADEIGCVAVSPQSDRAVTGTCDKSVLVWTLNSKDGSPIVLEGHSAGVERIFVTDDGLRIVSVAKDYDSFMSFEDEIFVWDIETQHVVHRFEKRDAICMSRREVFELVGELTVQDDASLSIPLHDRRIWYGEGQDKQCLATMESQVISWALSPDQKIMCVGLIDGQVGLMKLKR